MKSEWTQVQLKDILDFKNGKKRPNTSGNIPVYGGNGILGFAGDSNNQNCIIIGRVGAYCGSVFYESQRCWVSDNAICCIAKESSDIAFDYYLLKGLHLNERHIGTSQPLLTQEILNRIEILCPSLPEQRKIGSLLSLLDNKIKLNQKINENLERQLHALYMKIFAESAMDAALGDVVVTTSGGTPSRKHSEYYDYGNIGWVKSKELLGGYLHDTEEHINELAVAKSSAKLLPTRSVLIAMYGATVGAYGIISKPMACNQAICALLCNEKYPYTYLFQVACESQKKLINLAVGSAQQNISQILIKQLPVHSDENIIRRFHLLACPIHEKIEILQAENRQLSEIRDTLLPKLMAGEINLILKE